MDKVKIALMIPTYSDIPPKVYQSHLIACLKAMSKGIEVTHVGVTEKELICHARNRLAEALLGSDCTHALCLDADIVLPPWGIYAMVEVDQDIVSGVYFQKLPPYFPLIYTKHGYSRWKKKEKGLHKYIVQWPEDTIFPIDACGFGCCLIKREVFERVKKPWFEWTEESGEDIGFCMKVRAARMNIFCHSGVLCGHTTNKVVSMDDFNINDINTIQVKIGTNIEEDQANVS